MTESCLHDNFLIPSVTAYEGVEMSFTARNVQSIPNYELLMLGLSSSR